MSAWALTSDLELDGGEVRGVVGGAGVERVDDVEGHVVEQKPDTLGVGEQPLVPLMEHLVPPGNHTRHDTARRGGAG